jgi:Phospholipase_D-nuclease N-terminal
MARISAGERKKSTMPFLEIDFFTLITSIFWIWMLIDCLLNKRVKVFWLLVIFFTHWIGALIYYFTACSHRNPLEALSYYMRYISRLIQQKPASTAPPPPTPKSYSYSDYQQGYQAQQAQPSVVQPEEAAAYYPQPEYEQPTATYPEMPLQQH